MLPAPCFISSSMSNNKTNILTKTELKSRLFFSVGHGRVPCLLYLQRKKHGRRRTTLEFYYSLQFLSIQATDSIAIGWTPGRHNMNQSQSILYHWVVCETHTIYGSSSASIQVLLQTPQCSQGGEELASTGLCLRHRELVRPTTTGNS